MVKVKALEGGGGGRQGSRVVLSLSLCWRGLSRPPVTGKCEPLKWVPSRFEPAELAGPQDLDGARDSPRHDLSSAASAAAHRVCQKVGWRGVVRSGGCGNGEGGKDEERRQKGKAGQRSPRAGGVNSPANPAEAAPVARWCCGLPAREVSWPLRRLPPWQFPFPVQSVGGRLRCAPAQHVLATRSARKHTAPLEDDAARSRRRSTQMGWMGGWMDGRTRWTRPGTARKTAAHHYRRVHTQGTQYACRTTVLFWPAR
jgi:hypothetical protein